MQAFDYFKTIDKRDWPRGVWDSEPDKSQWPDRATNLPCLAVRNAAGVWCGYVGVPPTHPLYGVGYGVCARGGGDGACGGGYCEHSPSGMLDVHGGLTFSKRCASFNRKAWDAFRIAYLAHCEQAKKYPRGDSARFVREWRRVIDDYDRWRLRMHGRAVCHSPGLGESDDVWWFGFDCAHAGDLLPGMPLYTGLAGGVYRDQAYVRGECAKLAAQLAQVDVIKRKLSATRNLEPQEKA